MNARNDVRVRTDHDAAIGPPNGLERGTDVSHVATHVAPSSFHERAWRASGYGAIGRINA